MLGLRTEVQCVLAAPRPPSLRNPPGRLESFSGLKLCDAPSATSLGKLSSTRAQRPGQAPSPPQVRVLGTTCQGTTCQVTSRRAPSSRVSAGWGGGAVSRALLSAGARETRECLGVGDKGASCMGLAEAPREQV